MLRHLVLLKNIVESIIEENNCKGRSQYGKKITESMNSENCGELKGGKWVGLCREALQIFLGLKTQEVYFILAEKCL